MKVPTGAGALLAGCHPAIWLVWMSYRLCQTYEAHSGYCFYGSWLHSVGLTNSESQHSTTYDNKQQLSLTEEVLMSSSTTIIYC